MLGQEAVPTRPVGASKRTLLALCLFTPGSVARARADVLTGGVPLEVYAFSNGDVVRPLVPKLCARS